MQVLSLPKIHPLLRFALIAGVLYLIWFFGYERYLAVDGRLDALLTHNIASMSAGIMRVLGFDAAVDPADLNLVLVNKHPSVFILPFCDGMVLYALFTGFVLAFPGSSPHRIWFIPLGIVLIYLVNVLRVVALSLNHYYSQSTVEFNHHYTFVFIEYGFICLLWLWWATRLAEPVSQLEMSDANA